MQLMKRHIFTLIIIISSWAVGFAQDTRSAKTLELIISDNHNSAESRILACVRQGEFYINKPHRLAKDLDSASLSLKRGKQFSTDFNFHSTDGELLFLEGLIAKQKG